MIVANHAPSARHDRLQPLLRKSTLGARAILGIEFDEEPHLPLLHWTASFRSGGGRTVPVLVTDQGVFSDSTDILQFLDTHAAEQAKRYPPEPAARASCLALEEVFDRRLGPATRRVAYDFLLPARELLLGMLEREGGAPRWQRTVARPLFPVMRGMLRRGLSIDEPGVQRSRRAIDEVFGQVDERLKDGRRYPLGDCFSAANLTFAALAAPLVFPPEYGFPMPPLDRIPAHALSMIEDFRRTEPGRFALRLYARERGVRVAVKRPQPTELPT